MTTMKLLTDLLSLVETSTVCTYPEVLQISKATLLIDVLAYNWFQSTTGKHATRPPIASYTSEPIHTSGLSNSTQHRCSSAAAC